MPETTGYDPHRPFVAEMGWDAQASEEAGRPVHTAEVRTRGGEQCLVCSSWQVPCHACLDREFRQMWPPVFDLKVSGRV